MKVLGHLVAGIFTGGLWWVVLGIKYVTRPQTRRY